MYTRNQYNFATSKELKESCNGLFKGNHCFNISLIALSVLYAFTFGYDGIVLALNIFSFGFFTYRFVLSLFGISGDETADKKVKITKDLPKYCILLPMRNEPIPVIKALIKNMNKLNYPKDKLDIVMLIDIDDDYLEEAKNLSVPSHFRILSSEASFPFTKPKVCNLGLITTDAEFVSVYDAEDAPDPDQLLKVLYKFEQDENIACVQCRLNYNNKNHNWLSKFFNLEYLTWFSLTIVGLDKIQGQNAVIPLGGTSQHLRVKDLIEMGGWDAVNVTEDCDLGIRLARMGRRTIICDSVTNEIAVTEVKHWIPQRTRWQMGFMVTYINHCKSFVSLSRQLGPAGLFHFFMSIFGNFINPLITPLLFVIWFRSFFLGYSGETFLELLPWITLIGNFILIVATHLIASIKYQNGRFWYMAILQPIYYLLQVVSVHRAVYKLITAPYKWEKTAHTAE
jgi:cellulose synthase/poly-beta-1,6-N-acetylglucosamine synthase-like glycosyltransferase